MIAEKSKRILLGAALAGAAVSLAGCGSSMTYGTGTSPGVQTIEDLAGIVALSSKEKEPVDYKPRPAVVAPPSTAALPAPGSAQGTSQAANWPRDPDAAKRAMDEKQRVASAETGPGIALERLSDDPKFRVANSQPKENWYAGRFEQGYHGPVSDADAKKASKLFADARKSKTGSVDESGNPTRKYLTEPPSTYREPDPTAPTEISATDKPKKKTKFSLSNLWPF
jgi:hypothetical protein